MTRPNRLNRSKTLRKAQTIKPVRTRRAGRGDPFANRDTPSSHQNNDPHTEYQWGAVVQPDGDVRFRLWAPGESHVVLDFPDLEVQMMQRRDDGIHEAVVVCEPGTRYCYRFLDGRTMPDPASRCQDGDVHGLSTVVDPSAYAWVNSDWRGLPWHKTVLYEMHVGLAGGFEKARRKLPELAQLGITAIELMPIADFAGKRNWGYDGVLPYAPDESYGSPNQLRQFIDVAHGLGMQVFLDVVYNHFGPEGNYLYGHVPEFFRHDVQTPWGHAVDFRQPAVRAFFTDNALYWLREFRFDGLRLDAVHAITERDWLPELARTVRREFKGERWVHLVLENDDNDAQLLTSGFDAQWNDDAHHVVHHLLTGDADGYYAAYSDNPTQKLCRALSEGFVYQGEPFVTRDGAARGTPSDDLPSKAFVFFLQNHDQVGNRALGERLRLLCEDRPDALQAAVALQLLTPHIPLIFMGEERGARNPFLYFTDFADPDLIEAIREGRRREFQRFSGFSETAEHVLPDPNDEDTWARSNPYAEPVHEQVYQYYAELLTVRHQFISPYLNDARVRHADIAGAGAVVVRWRLDNDSLLSVYSNLSPAECRLPRDTVGVNERCIFTNKPRADLHAQTGRLSAETTVVTLVASSDSMLQNLDASEPA